MSPASFTDRMPRLSPREREILTLLVEGQSNTEIAAQLYLSLNTIKTHVRSILAERLILELGLAVLFG